MISLPPEELMMANRVATESTIVNAPNRNTPMDRSESSDRDPDEIIDEKISRPFGNWGSKLFDE